MNKSSEKVLSYLAGYSHIAAVPVEDLQKLVAENPFFPIGHFLLAEKFKGENEAEYQSQAQKTALYFFNPFWLQYQLTQEDHEKKFNEFQQDAITIEDKATPGVSETEPLVVNESHPDTTHSSPLQLVTQAVAANGILQKIPEQEFSEANNVQNSNAARNAEPATGIELLETENIQAEEELSATARNTDKEAESFINQPPPATVTTEFIDSGLPPDLSSDASAEVVELEEEMASVTRNTDKTTEQFLNDISGRKGDDNLTPDDEHDRMFKNIKAMLDASSEDADADTKDAVVPLDPYYTIDYFASQGIKLELDQNPQDQLGQNLKKFTQWLRHMKKLGPEDATEAINRTESEADIQQIADSSNTVREVVTEAMASVLEKQGKKDKAMELYNKLSFLNPDKSAYFADKIKKLKGF